MTEVQYKDQQGPKRKPRKGPAHREGTQQEQSLNEAEQHRHWHTKNEAGQEEKDNPETSAETKAPMTNTVPKRNYAKIHDDENPIGEERFLDVFIHQGGQPPYPSTPLRLC